MKSETKPSLFLISSFSEKLKVGILIAILVLVTTSVLSFITFRNVVKEEQMLNHSNDVKYQIEKLLSCVKDAETSVRGFVITRDSTHVARFNKAEVEVAANYESLKNLISDNDFQKKMLDSLNMFIVQKIITLKNVVDAYSQLSDTLPRPKIRFPQGKTQMDNARAIVNKMQLHEQDLLTKRYGQSQEYIRQSQVILIIYFSTAIAIISIAFFLLLRSLKVIKEKEKTYRNIFEYSNDLLCLCTNKFKLIEANPAFIAAFSKDPNDIEEFYLDDIFTYANDAKDIKQKLASKQNEQRSRIILKGKNGEQLICRANFILIDIENKIYSVVLTDMTKQIQMQQESEALERFANIGKVSRLLAHEVRNPLTNVHLALESIYADSKDDDLIPFYRIIERNALRINKLITELLNSTRPTVLDYEDIDLSLLLEETLALAKDRMNLNHVTIETNIESTLPTIKGDKEKLSIALLNIIINAIEAIQAEEGHISITAKSTDNRFVQITVTDNGVGMEEETIEKIFHPFFTKKQSGTGLGLASTQNIILTHKGRIDVKSIKGEGTSFAISLPLE